MNCTSTVEITTYRDLAPGDIFLGVKTNGNLLLGMKVETKDYEDDQPGRDVLELNPDKAPGLFSDHVLGRNGLVAKFNSLSFTIHPRKEDFLFDGNQDVRARLPGCAFLIGEDIFLSVEMLNNQQPQGIYYVNMKTGEARRAFPAQKAVTIPRWQIIATIDDKKSPWLEYIVPSGKATEKAA